jgi:molybdate transport system regulatory protein
MAKKKPKIPPPISIRIRLHNDHFLGPGKIRLMELIGELGSISAAAREMGMAYRQAWLLIDELNSLFTEPVVLKQTGGSQGGGAKLTQFGRDVIGIYRDIETSLTVAAASAIDKLRRCSQR